MRTNLKPGTAVDLYLAIFGAYQRLLSAVNGKTAARIEVMRGSR
jgi:hypothetical protein